MRSPRATARALVAVVTAATLAGPFAFTGTAAEGCGTPGPSSAAGSWKSVAAPEFPVGEAEITSFDISPLVQAMLVTNGQAVMRSLDGGCTWQVSYVLPDLPSEDYQFSIRESHIVDVVISESAAAAGRVFLTIEQSSRALLGDLPAPLPKGPSRPHVLLSNDVGGTWSEAGGLVAEAGRPDDLVTSPRFPDISYLLVDGGEDTSHTLYRTDDGGASWSARGTFLISGVADMVMDPMRAEELWLYGSAGLYQWIDGAADPRLVEDVPPGVSAVDVASAPEARHVTAFSVDEPIGFASTDAGQTWRRIQLPGIVNSSARGRFADEVVVSADAGVYARNLFGWADISPAGHRTLFGLRSTFANGVFRVIGHADGVIHIWKAVRLVLPDPDDDPPVIARIPPDRRIDLKEPRFLPDDERVVLGRGESKTVHYKLLLPRTPTPLDVYFLVDVSGSMQDTIDGVRAALYNIIRQLIDAGIDVWFGVGEYRSFDDPPAYHRIRDVGPPNASLASALQQLWADGGGDETQLEALFQVATGIGFDGPGAIAPGQQANFRDVARRVVIHATDEPFSEDGPHRDYPDVIAALNRAGADQVGLAIQPPSTGGLGLPTVDPVPKDGLDRIARGTGALAPPVGVDCDGDGTPDLDYGEPLVCIVDPNNAEDAATMAPAIVNVLQAIEDRAAIELSASSEEDVATVTPTLWPDVNLKQWNMLEFDVRYRCPGLKRANKFPVTIQATARGHELAREEVTLVCRVPAKPPPVEVAPFLAPIPPLVVPVFRPPAPPPNAPPNPQPNPQPQSQAQAQGALARQQQEQPQLAFVHQPVAERLALEGERVNEEDYSGGYAMVSYQDRAGVPVREAAFIAAAVAMSFAFGLAALARERAKVQYATARGGARRRY